MISRAGHVVNDGLTAGAGSLGVVSGVDFTASLANVTAWGGQAWLYRQFVDAGLRAVEGAVDRDLALTIGSVAGWRSGVLDLRTDALQRLSDLQDQGRIALSGAVLGLPPESVGAFLELQLDNPLGWPRLDAKDPVVRVGGFRGLGGPWLSPPRSVGRDADGRLTARCADGSGWRLEADVFGSRVTSLDRQAAGSSVEVGVGLDTISYLVTLTAELR